MYCMGSIIARRVPAGLGYCLSVSPHAATNSCGLPLCGAAWQAARRLFTGATAAPPNPLRPVVVAGGTAVTLLDYLYPYVQTSGFLLFSFRCRRVGANARHGHHTGDRKSTRL